MSFAGPSNFGSFRVLKKLKSRLELLLTDQGGQETEIDIKGKILGVNYYESIYSPMLTGSFLELDTGGTVNNKEGKSGTLKDALPVEGFEEVLFGIQTGSGNLSFQGRNFSTGGDRKSFVITGSPYNFDTGNKQSAFYPMVSTNAFVSANSPVKKSYPDAPISEIVRKILQDRRGLKLPDGRVFVEDTKNTIKLTGDNQPPLDTILKLCKKAQPLEGDPGYFFFETKSGFHFKSIHGMIKKGIEDYGNGDLNYKRTHQYRYGSLLEANLDNDTNNFKILKPPVVRRDQDQMTAIRNGQYKVRVCTIDSITGEYKEKIIQVDNNPKGTLGKVDNQNLQNDQNNGTDSNDNFCKTFSYVLNYDEGSSIIDNPSEYEPRAMMKYGMLHAQLVDIQVPCNVNLEAGQVIRVLFENITQDNKTEIAYNLHRSGFYLILHLCHHFDSSNSFTSLTLARDGYGLYNTKK
jgi:hypothetical protein|tara:strand:+ start:1985 stop:3370 length:1386 start_codon:yes stop_codon:yes gene_type:complete